jgi:hypothetical protein
MLKTMFPEEARLLTMMKVRTLLYKMVSDNILTLYKEKYQLTKKEYKKIVDFRERQANKGTIN